MFEYLKLTRGLQAARSGLEQLVVDQIQRDIGPRMRWTRDGDRMRGYPIIDLTPRCREMAEAAKCFDWFAHIGKPLADDDDVVPVDNWKDAVRLLRTRQWYNYTVDAMNAISVPVSERSQIVYAALWNEVVETIDYVLTDDFFESLKGHVPVTEEQRECVVSEIQIMVRMACIEEHWSHYVQTSVRAFLRMYEWIGQGRLPCGAIGRYPSSTLCVL